MGSLLERTYRRLGPRYVQRALFVEHQLGYITIISAVIVLSFYLDMSFGQFVRLTLVGCAFHLVFGVLTRPFVRRVSRPVVLWLEGSRSDEQTVEAWRAAASIPWEVLRRELWSPTLGVALWSFNLGWSLYLAWEFGLPVYSAFLIYIGIMVYVCYYVALRFFGVERVMRPVLDDIAAALPDGATPRAPGFSLRGRLLAALPAINVITAVTASGLAGGGKHGLPTLAAVVLIAAAVAATLSLVLTLLLSSSITEPIAALRAATARVGRGDFSARVPLVTTDETGDLARSFNEMAAGLAERERIREAFGTYVDRDVADHILKEGTSLAGEEVEVTMMFLDVRDFTGFAERSSAPEVVATLNRLFDLIVPVIGEHGGHVDKFVGDGLLAVFGAPRRHEDHADRALAAALNIDLRIREEFTGGLEVGIGLNSGRVVAGNVGGAGRFEFSVIGDAVNVAARVESATRATGDTVLIAERTRELLRDGSVQLDERIGVTLKGKRDTVCLYAPRPAIGARAVAKS
jgi:class 3 adenylate cyclase